MIDSTPIPVIVIGGYLGVGKTTLVNHLLRHAQNARQRIAVLVNDFGEIDIDADLIEGQDGAVLSLAGGCVCCSFGADLVGALQTVTQRLPKPDIVLVETSGVALPGAVARSAKLANGFNVLGIVVVADAGTLRERAADRYVGDTVTQQLRDADLLILNKIDTVNEEGRASVIDWLQRAVDDTPVVSVENASVPPEILLNLRTDSGPAGLTQLPGGRIAAIGHEASRLFESRVLTFASPTSVTALAVALTTAGSGVLRAKGMLTDSGSGNRVVLQVVGTRWTTHLAPQTDGNVDGRIVVIGLCGQLAALCTGS